MSGRIEIRAFGAALFSCVIAATVLSVVGIGVVARGHAPDWALLVFLALLGVSVPLGAVVGYLFCSPRESDHTEV